MHPIELKLKIKTKDLLDKGYSVAYVRNALKEYLQDIILFIIFNDSYLKNLIFYGGTCLRKLYDLNRVSEDLDFEADFKLDLDKTSEIILDWFRRDHFDKVESSIQESRNVSRVLLKFRILHDLGLSPNENEKLHVKVEVKKGMKSDYPTELTAYVKDQYSMVIKHYDLQTLMAGKMVACLERSFVKGSTGVKFKGRDFYDLVWYMQKGIIPNERLLSDYGYTKESAFAKLDKKVEEVQAKGLLMDLSPLFENQEFIKTWCENFHDFYARYRGEY